MKHIVTIILFGAIWGLLEATLGGVLHLARLPITGTIMASIGFAILFAALRAGVKPANLATIALVAASFKFLDAPLLGMPVLDRTILNPAMAIASQGLGCALFLRKSSIDAPGWQLGGKFLGAAAFSVMAFNAVSVWGFGWQTFQSAHMLRTMLVHVPLIALAATALSELLVDRLHFNLRVGWQTAAVVGTITLMFASKMIIRQ
jgi:hypothetical protein